MRHADIIVIGGGVAGLAAAYALSAFAKVILLEKESRCAYHATGRATGNFAQNFGPPVVRQLTTYSRPFMFSESENLQEKLCGPLGTLLLAKKGQTHLLEKEIKMAQSFGSSITAISLNDALKKVPVINTEHIEAAAFDTMNFNLDVMGLVRKYHQCCVQNSAHVETQAEVLSLEKKNKHWHAVTTRHTYAAPIIVNAAGAWADTVAALAAVKPVGLRSFLRTAYIFETEEPHKNENWPLVQGVDFSVYFKPTENGSFLASPCDETFSEPCNAKADESALQASIDSIMQLTHLKVKHISTKWGGLRTFSSDNLPVVGFDPNAEGFFWLAGLGGYGNKISPALADICASMVQHQVYPAGLTQMGIGEGTLSPRRFLS